MKIVKKLQKFSLSAGLATGVLSAMLTTALHAQEAFPTRSVTMMIGYGTGGGTDVQARLAAQHLEKKLGVPVVVQNVPGAGSQVAASTLLRDGTDGYTILATNQPDLSITMALGNAPYKLSDFETVALDIYEPRIVMVLKDSPYQSFDAFVAAAKEAPGKLSFAVTAGGAQEQFARWLVGELGIDVRVVGYPSGGETTTAVMGGHVTATIGDDFARFSMRDDATALLIGSDKASPRWPEAELMADALARYNVTPPSPDHLARYQTYVVPASVKTEFPERFAKLQEAITSLATDPDYGAIVKERGFEDLSLMAAPDAYNARFEATHEALMAARPSN